MTQQQPAQNQTNDEALFSRVHHLVGAALDRQMSAVEAAELQQLVVENPAARRMVALYIEDSSALGSWAEAVPATSVVSGASPELAENATKGVVPSFRTPHSAFRISAIAAVVAFVAIGILAYSFWPRPAGLPVVQQTPAAKIAGLTDAKWAGASSQAGDTLIAGQQLLLQSGSAEITFNDHARVMLQGPAEFVVVDAGACRLATGRLTAHVPDLAKGFKVHTPDGTVTDLGTDFGVYVGNEAGGGRLEEAGEEEQQPGGGQQPDGKQPPITEVHVFKGQVDVAPGDQLAQAAGQENPPPQSEIRNQKSKIISAGQAVTISEKKVEPLPAADPFKFALDKLQGKPRQVLLSEDFETYELGHQVQAIGPWIVQSGIRKGQGVSVIDPVQRIAQSNAEGFTPIAPPPSLVGRRVAYLGASAPNPPDTFPLLAREIDGRLLAQNCQVLLEFDVFLHGVGFQHSLTLATEIGHTSGIELWRDTDAAKKVDVAGLNWYRLRVLLDVANGAPRDVRVERSHWRGQDGWVRDLSFQPPLPKLDWSTPPRYVIFGYPVVTPSTPAGTLWIDNVRMEVISEK